MASNLKVVSTNAADSATITASTEAGLLIATNMQLDSKTEVWRSTGTSATVTAIFTQQNVSCVSFPICNFTSTATMQVQVHTTSGGGVALDTGAVLCCEYTTIDKIDFASGPLNANTFSYGGGTYATLFFTSTLAEKVVISIVDSGNTNGYVEASSLVVGDEWSPTYNADFGVSWSILDTSKHSRNDSGDYRTNRGARYRTLTFTLGAMNAADRTAFMQILIRNGMSIPMFISIFPESTDNQEKQLYQIYGKLNKLVGVTRIRYLADKGTIQINEI